MLRLTPSSTTLRAAPLGREERAEAVRAVLRPQGVMARREGYATTVGCTITYYHLSEAANGSLAVSLLADALDWADTDVAVVAGAVAVTTNQG